MKVVGSSDSPTSTLPPPLSVHFIHQFTLLYVSKFSNVKSRNQSKARRDNSLSFVKTTESLNHGIGWGRGP